LARHTVDVLRGPGAAVDAEHVTGVAFEEDFQVRGAAQSASTTQDREI